MAKASKSIITISAFTEDVDTFKQLQGLYRNDDRSMAHLFKDLMASYKETAQKKPTANHEQI
jgi:hypothetical protein